jgi:hypothetical protein
MKIASSTTRHRPRQSRRSSKSTPEPSLRLRFARIGDKKPRDL